MPVSTPSRQTPPTHLPADRLPPGARFGDLPRWVHPFWSTDSPDRIADVAIHLDVPPVPHVLATDDPVLARYLFKRSSYVLVSTVVECSVAEYLSMDLSRCVVTPCESPLYDLAESAARVGVTTRTVQNWSRSGKVRTYRTLAGRLCFDLDDLRGAKR